MPANSILIIGGSGFVSGALARRAVDQGRRVWAVTRGQRPLPEGVIPLVADRRDPAVFERAVAGARTTWDLVVDCIGYEPADARQDIAVFRGRTPHLVFISTDFVYHPAHRRFPQDEETGHYASGGYGGNKRLCEQELTGGDTGGTAWTILRPCHIYGPGSLLGCLPLHSRDPQLLARLRSGAPLRLAGGGHFLQQPILAGDLADLILSIGGNPKAHNQVFCAAGPDILESRDYYRIIADLLGVPLRVEEVPVSQYLREHPESAPFLCHRIYDTSRIQSVGAKVPATPIEQGLREHVESLT